MCAMAFVFAIGSSAYAQNQSGSCCKPEPVKCCPPRFDQGMPLCCDTYPRAINAPARIDVAGCWDWDVYASFIYWHVSQESMDIAIKDVSPISTPASTLATANLVVDVQPFKYKPGFKVGAGFSFGSDGWVCFAEYTRLHQKTSKSSTLASPAFWFPVDWIFIDLITSGYSPTNLVSKWKMNFDMVDLDFSRPFYQGTHLTVSPYAGMRGLWITQSMFVGLNPNLADSATGKVLSHCWSVGPNAGVSSNWLVGWGFRFEGQASTSLLYTRYTKVASRQFNSAAASSFKPPEGAASIPVSVTGVLRNYNVLRPTMELGVGLGWGSYFSCSEYYLDFSVRYDFLQFWSQNMMRYEIFAIAGVGATVDNLQMHGITATARFDF